MNLKEFDKLKGRDLLNGAVLNEIRQVFKEHAQLQVRVNCGILDKTCCDCEDVNCLSARREHPK